MCEPDRKQFLHSELFSMTLMATVQRGNVYAGAATPAQRTSFQATLREHLEATLVTYSTPKTDKDHETNISQLADMLSASHKSTLANGRFRIGSAQKALNLWLKYLWCVGELPTPPHCPFDSQIIRLLPPAVRCNWTALDSLEGYRALVAAARKLAGGRSLAHWELDVYNGP
jgi:hypothetical protein